MSLKSFHVIFITAASALSFGCGIWGVRDYWTGDGGVSRLLFGLGSFAAGAGLIFYERYFLKKLKSVGYL
jgi:hypothetical protein